MTPSQKSTWILRVNFQYYCDPEKIHLCLIQQTCQQHPYNPFEVISGILKRDKYGNIYEEDRQGGLKP